MNEGLLLRQLAADKSGADVMKLPPHNINLGRARAQAEPHLRIPLSLIDLLSSRPSQCNSSRASWWGAAPAHQSVVGTQRTPCDRGNLWRSALDKSIMFWGLLQECNRYFGKKKIDFGEVSFSDKEVCVPIACPQSLI